MLVFTPQEVDAVSRETFIEQLEARLREAGEQDCRLDPQERQLMWSAAKDASRFGITTIRGCLVLCHIYWDLGLDCLERIPAFATIANDGEASERDKVQALWLLRTQLLATLAQG